MDPNQDYWIRVWEDTLFWRQSGALLWRADPVIFGAKMAPCCGGWIHFGETHFGAKTAPYCKDWICVYWILKYGKVL